MASIDTLLDFVMPAAPGLSVELARLAIRQAAIQFCRRSGVDGRTLDPFDTVSGQAFYTLTAPADTVINEVVAVTLDGKLPTLDPLRMLEIPEDAETFLKKPEWFSADQGGTRLQLIYCPDAIYSASVKVALEPSSSSVVILDWIATTYGQEIGFGALQELLAMPKKPWTDAAMSSYYKGKFDNAIVDAESDSDRGFTAAPTRTRSCFGLR